MKRLLLIVFSTCLLVATAFVATTSCSSNEPQETEETSVDLSAEEQALNANLAAYTADFFAGREESRGFGKFFKKLVRAITIGVADVGGFLYSWDFHAAGDISDMVSHEFDEIDRNITGNRDFFMNFNVTGNKAIKDEFEYCQNAILEKSNSSWLVQGALHNVVIISKLQKTELNASVRSVIEERKSEIIPREGDKQISLKLGENTSYADIIDQFIVQFPDRKTDLIFLKNYVDGLSKCESMEECLDYYQGYMNIIKNEPTLRREKREYLKGIVEFETRSMNMWYGMMYDYGMSIL